MSFERQEKVQTILSEGTPHFVSAEARGSAWRELVRKGRGGLSLLQGGLFWEDEAVLVGVCIDTVSVCSDWGLQPGYLGLLRSFTQ